MPALEESQDRNLSPIDPPPTPTPSPSLSARMRCDGLAAAAGTVDRHETRRMIDLRSRCTDTAAHIGTVASQLQSLPGSVGCDSFPSIPEHL